ncbi:long-chain-fatty-acid--CoA ligase [Rhodococcus sp. C26F]
MTDPKAPGTGTWQMHRRMTIADQVARHARVRPDRTALSFGGHDLSYRALDQRVNRVSRSLRTRGVRHGDRVAILMRNRIEFLESFYAVVRLGAIAVPVNFRLVAPEIGYILADSGAKVLITDGSGLAAAGPALSGGTARKVITVGPVEASARIDSEDYEELLDPDGSVIPEDVLRETDPAVIMYTSGTTGRPKGAVLSHQNLLMNSVNCSLLQGVGDEDECWYSGLPLFHIAGLAGILMYLLTGGRSIIADSDGFDAVATVDLLERERVTSCYFVPTQWRELCEVPGVTERTAALRRISWGASIAPRSVLQRMAEKFPGKPNFNMFGQTEMSPVTCALPGEDAIRKMGSVGRPLPNVEMRIIGADGADVAVGEIGEAVYRGPTTMLGYWNNPAATEAAFAGGWFHSGDLCVMDEEGFVTVVDRMKDMIVSGGENIYSAEVEAAIESHPQVAEVAVIGVPHPKWVETPLAVIVPVDPADPPQEADVIAHCARHLASYKKPTAVMVVAELPRNATGKILKFRLREDFSPAR